jgi:hypothetical protein
VGRNWAVDLVNTAVYLACFAFCASVAAAAPAEQRIALVIGNGAYQHTSPLANPPNDARLVARTLRAVGFEVIERIDVDQEAMKLAVRDFGDRLEKAGETGVGLFYYAGHGVQVGGNNYMVPVGADLRRESDVDIFAVGASSVVGTMAFARNRLNFVILDACRNNPFARSFRSASRGLARMDAPRGTLIAYATSPGDVAADGTGANSPYSAALVKAMRTPGLSAEAMFKSVRLSVIAATGEAQVPWEASSLTGDFYFSPGDAKPLAKTKPAPGAEPQGDGDREALFWRSIEDSTNPAVFDEFLKQFPDGTFAGLARIRAQELRAAANAAEGAPTASRSGETSAAIEMPGHARKKARERFRALGPTAQKIARALIADTSVCDDSGIVRRRKARTAIRRLVDTGQIDQAAVAGAVKQSRPFVGFICRERLKKAKAQ